jgi:hypothetical protein
MPKPLLILVFVLSLSSCGHEHFLGEFDTINTSDAIKAMFRKCAQDVSKNGLKRKLHYFSRDLNSFWILQHTDEPLQDYNAYYKNWETKQKLIHYEIDDLSIHVYLHCKERASFYYQVKMSYTDSVGKQHDLHLLESGTVMKLNEESDWTYLNGHLSEMKPVEH